MHSTDDTFDNGAGPPWSPGRDRGPIKPFEGPKVPGLIAKAKKDVASMLPQPKTVLGTQVGGSHYTDCAIQPIEYIWANNLGFSEGNVVKYVTRWKTKGGIKDLKKAHHHLALKIEEEERKLAAVQASADASGS